MRVPARHPHPRHFATHAMPPRTRGAADADADAGEIVIDDSPERPSKRTKPVQWRHRGVKSKDTCVFPGCNIPVDRGVGSHSAYPLFTEPVDARCCDRCSSRVVVDRAARTHPAFPLRECMHPADPGHSCAFTSDGSNMEKWKSWAIGPENGNGSDHDLRFESATSQLTDLIGKSGCLECAHQFLWRCKVISNKTLHRLAREAMVARVLIDYTRDEVRPAAVKAVFDDWWGSSSKFDLQSSFIPVCDAYTGTSTGRAQLVAKLFGVIPESTFFKFIGALSEARVQWWSPVIWHFKETGDAWKCFQIMLKDMNRELKLSKDSVEMKSMYVDDIDVILSSWLVRGDHADVQRFIESKGIKLRGKSVLGEVADAINLPSVICDICAGDIVDLDTNQEDLLYESHNIRWFASLYHPSRGTARLKWTRSCWSEQQSLFECQGDASDELILDAMELLITHFRPYAINPCVFGRAILRALEEDQQLGFGNKLILLFLNNSDTRSLCTWPSTQNEVREYFGDNISHVFVGLFTGGYEATSHEFFSLMSHVFVNAFLSDRESDWRVDDWGRDDIRDDMYRMLNLRPSDFAQEVREHENFWLKDDDGATRADKRAALQLAQSSIDKVKERMPDGIYKEVMDDLMTQWNDA